MAAMTVRRWWIAGAGIIVVALVVVIAIIFSGTTGPSGPESTAPIPSASRTASASSTPKASATPGATSTSPRTTAAPPASASPAPASSPAKGKAEQVLAAMTLEQRVGQVLMVSSPVTGPDADSLYALDTLYVGNVFMKGRSTAGQAVIADEVSAITRHVSGDRTQGVRPFVATDQEGGFVQIMRGPGFTDIPQAIEQSQLPVPELLQEATTWGEQLSTVGVNVNLAPVLDTVPSAAFAPQNPPIGAFGREFGYTPAQVSSHGLAFAKGMASAGVDATAKHFPGLGRVTANTDVAAGVVDDITVRNDPFVQPFKDAVAAGVPWLMMSNASYPKIDPSAMAPFSRVLVHDMVRGDLGFKGIIVSDDICDAVQVAVVPVGERGVEFIRAGGTMALCTNQALVPQMYAGMLSAAKADPGFAAQIDDAARLVLQKKVDRGLVD